jgi:hypothetical protein
MIEISCAFATRWICRANAATLSAWTPVKGNNPQTPSDPRRSHAVADVDVPVLFRETAQLGVRMFETEAIAASVTCRLAKQTMGRVWRRASRSSAQRR